MIFEWIINVVLLLGQNAVDSIPNVSLPIDLAAYLAPVANFFGYLNTFVSLQLLSVCISTVLIVDNWALIVKNSFKSMEYAAVYLKIKTCQALAWQFLF